MIPGLLTSPLTTDAGAEGGDDRTHLPSLTSWVKLILQPYTHHLRPHGMCAGRIPFAWARSKLSALEKNLVKSSYFFLSSMQFFFFFF